MKELKINGLSKSYYLKKKKIEVLKDVTVMFEKGKFYVIKGHSGSGKSTLIRILGLLDTFDSGKYFLENYEVNLLSPKQKAVFRKKLIGFVFQDFCLDPYLKTYENVELPMIINNKIDKKERKYRALELLQKVGLSDRINHFPKELSGGEQQRVAIARALANDPEIILADEPTGNLDAESEKNVFEILRELSIEGKCVIVVSHSNEIVKFADEVYQLESGILIKEKK